ncbi:hypothetical protein BKA70DRAFT_1219745 [Coprinopsis sp. MPI-PUGE-AT-0042]|nr:hypothetical protein BKA70DRAFT_1219745 [Coprinopsis sp. MPI-PUGE-AT-0042]
MAIHSNAAVTFFNNIYLVTVLLANVDWVFLALIQQDAMQERIQGALIQFIPGCRIRKNFNVIDCCSGLVVGSAARYPVVAGRSFHVLAPNDLNIIVAPNEAEDMMNDMEDFNYQYW